MIEICPVYRKLIARMIVLDKKIDRRLRLKDSTCIDISVSNNMSDKT